MWLLNGNAGVMIRPLNIFAWIAERSGQRPSLGGRFTPSQARALPSVALALTVLFTPGFVRADEQSDLISDVVSQHILPGFEALAQSATVLDKATQQDCRAESPALQNAYTNAFDAWIKVSHLRFGPTEVDNRAFALAFWPDPRGKTTKALNGMIRSQDDAVFDYAAFTKTSIAGQGFYALDFLLFDAKFTDPEDAEYTCALIRAITGGIDITAAAILDDWQQRYSALLLSAGDGKNVVYQSREEALQELFKAVTAGLQFTSETRLGRPLGSYDRPRPNRAEARRSGRSLRHVMLSLEATRDLAQYLARSNSDVAGALDARFGRAILQGTRLDDPVFAGVAAPQTRFRVEALQQSVNDIRDLASGQLGPLLGVAAGFNALDGD